MKRLLFLVAGGALAFFMGVAPASADNGPHVSLAVSGPTTGVTIAQAGASKCAGCHRAHTAQASYLLVQEQPALCFTCHDGSLASTDVKDGYDTNGQALRGGGFDTAMIGSGSATKDVILNGTRLSGTNQMVPIVAATATTSKHSIDTVGTMWGNGGAAAGAGTTVTLECSSCHDPHGNGNYRILRPIPDSSVASAGVNIPDATTKVYTTTNYWLSADSNVPLDTSATAVAFTGTPDATADGYVQDVSAWCTTCHTRYLAGHGSYGTARIDPTTGNPDPTFMYQHRTDTNYKSSGPNCITCHVAHGSNAGMTGNATHVAVPGGGGTTLTASNDSRLLRVDNRGVCLMCHNV